MRYILILLFSSIIYGQGSGNIVNSLNVPTSVPNPTVLIGANPVPSGTWKVYIKNDILWETYNINGLENFIYTKSDVKYKPITYTPNYAEITTALGFTPYNNSNPAGYINTEVDPVWTSVSGNYRTKTQNDLLYQPIGTYITTEVDPTVPSYSKTLSAFSVIKSSTDPLYVSLTGSYANPTFITSLDYSKLTNTPSIPSAQVNSDWNASSGIAQILNKPSLATVATTGSYNDLINKPTIPSAQIQTDWNAVSGLGVLLNKPTIPTDNNQIANGSGYIKASSTNTLTNKSGNISQWTNDSGYLTGITLDQINTALGYTPYNGTTNPNGYISSVPAQSFASLTGKPTTLSGYGITDAYPLTGNPSGFLTTITSGQVTGALGFTPVTNTRTLTINGTSFDLSANRTWTVGDLSSSGSYANPTWITSLAYSKLTGTPTIPTNTSQISESGNLYYTDARARASISLTTTGTGGASYNNSTGVLNIPTPVIPNDYTNTVAVAGGAGNAVFYLTSDKTSTGTALYTTVTYVNPIVNDSTVNYTYGWSYNAGTKALTVNVKQATGINVALVGLTLLGVPANAPNSTNVSVLVKGN